MRTTTRRLLAAISALAGLLGVHAGAAAATAVQDASSCRHYGLNTVGGLYQDYGVGYMSGVRDAVGSGTDFVCPLVRASEAGAGGLRVTFPGSYHQLLCVLYSDSNAGSKIAPTSAYLDSTSGPTSLTLPQSQIPMWSVQAVYCLFPVAPAYSQVLTSLRLDL